MTTSLLRWLRRLWPDTVASRIAVILMAALFAVLSISMLAYVRDRADATLHLFSHSVADRIAATVRLMEETPAAGRDPFIAAIDSPTLRVALSSHAPFAAGLETDGGRLRSTAPRPPAGRARTRRLDP